MLSLIPAITFDILIKRLFRSTAAAMVFETTQVAVKNSCLLDGEKRNNDFPSNPYLPVIKSAISCGANVRWDNLKPC